MATHRSKYILFNDELGITGLGKQGGGILLDVLLGVGVLYLEFSRNTKVL